MRYDAVAALVVTCPFLMGAAAAPVDRERVVFTYSDPQIVESSGLAVVDGLFVTVNDSGDTGRVFVVDPATGDTVGVTSWSDEPVDDEALAPGCGAAGGTEPAVWVGDLGDNRLERDHVVVRRVPVGRGDRTVTPADSPSYRLTYPDGPHDAESLLCEPGSGRLYVASKGVLGGELYVAPARLGAGDNELTPVGPVLGLATDGAFAPDGRHLVLRDYDKAVVYAMPELSPVATVDLPRQEQGEALAIDGRGRVYAGTEGTRTAVLRVPLPAGTLDAPASPPASPPAGPPASGSASGSSVPSPSATPSPPRTISREDVELPESTETEPSAWPWLLSAFLAVGFLMVLLRSMRRR